MTAALLALTAIAGIAAVIAHEVTHYAAARIVGRSATIDWRAVDTVWRVDDHVEARDRAIMLAPVLIGLALIPAYAAAVSTPGDVWLPATVAWGMYTLGGIKDDIPGGLGFATPTREP